MFVWVSGENMPYIEVSPLPLTRTDMLHKYVQCRGRQGHCFLEVSRLSMACFIALTKRFLFFSRQNHTPVRTKKIQKNILHVVFLSNETNHWKKFLPTTYGRLLTECYRVITINTILFSYCFFFIRNRSSYIPLPSNYVSLISFPAFKVRLLKFCYLIFIISTCSSNSMILMFICFREVYFFRQNPILLCLRHDHLSFA